MGRAWRPNARELGLRVMIHTTRKMLLAWREGSAKEQRRLDYGRYTPQAALQMSHSDDASRQGPLPVYIDGLVILKIIKHVQDEGSEFVNGDLVGLDVTRRLIKSFPELYENTKPVPSEPLRVEVTNCVPELPYVPDTSALLLCMK